MNDDTDWRRTDACLKRPIAVLARCADRFVWLVADCWRLFHLDDEIDLDHEARLRVDHPHRRYPIDLRPEI